jgi:hypothetical protein
MNQITTSSTRLARIAGLLYLTVAVFSAFSYNYVSARVYVPGDAAATGQNVLANAGLVRFGVVADLVYATAWIFLAIALYLLFRHVNEIWARALVLLVAVGAGIVCLTGVLPAAALRIATDGSYATALGHAGSNALVLLLLDIHQYGSLSAAVFMGLWLAPFGYLAYKSGLFPRALGVALVAGAVCYLTDVLAALLVPDFGTQIHPLAMIVSPIGEVWMLGYLLVKGVGSVSPSNRAPAADIAPALA